MYVTCMEKGLAEVTSCLEKSKQDKKNFPEVLTEMRERGRGRRVSTSHCLGFRIGVQVMSRSCGRSSMTIWKSDSRLPS